MIRQLFLGNSKFLLLFWGLGGIFKSRIPLENSRIPSVF